MHIIYYNALLDFWIKITIRTSCSNGAYNMQNYPKDGLASQTTEQWH